MSPRESFRSRFNDERFAHTRQITFSPTVDIGPTLFEVYAALSGGSLPEPSGGGWYWNNGEAITERGDGLVKTTTSRGFMPGMGETLTYDLLVGDDVRITVEDWWEDNIADPEEHTYDVRAATPEALERAVEALIAAARKGIDPKR